MTDSEPATDNDEAYVPNEFAITKAKNGLIAWKFVDVIQLLALAATFVVAVSYGSCIMFGQLNLFYSFGVVIGSFLIAETSTRFIGRTRFSYWVLWRFRSLHSTVTRWLFRQSTLVFLVLIIAAPAIVYEFTESPTLTALATVFYATVIVLKEVLLGEAALLQFHPEKSYYNRNSESNYLRYTSLLQNVGSNEASAVTISYRVYDATGKPLTEIQDAELPANYLSLSVGESIPANQIFAPISMDLANESKQTLQIHYMADAGISYSLVPTRVRLETELGEE